MKVLIVDDAPAMQQFLKFTLKAIPAISCESAHDGLGALQMLSRNPYNLVLLDLSLPLFDGMRLLSQMRSPESPNRSTPVVIISTVHDQETLRRARNADVTHVFPKPVQAAPLLDAVCEALGIPTRTKGDERRQARRLLIPVHMRFLGEEPFEATTWDISLWAPSSCRRA
jgi:two-component system chemotaxis response regulator CheY